MEQVIQALAEPTRRRILGALQAQPDADLTVDQVAAAAGVHRTVAFAHLETLARAGLLQRGRRAGGRGRPAHTYRAAGAAEFSHPPRQHRLLATLLATAVAQGGGAASARRLGVACGAGLATAGSLGADLEFDGDRIHARNCVFGEACEAAREVVCGLQAGILEGALGRPVEPLGPDGDGGCSYVMRATGGAG